MNVGEPIADAKLDANQQMPTNVKSYTRNAKSDS